MTLTSKASLYLVGVLLLAVTLCCPRPAEAQGNIKMGRLKVVPTIKYNVKYDDNIFSEIEGLEKYDDVIHTITGGLALEYMKEANEPGPNFKTGIEIAPVVYSDHDENNYTKVKFNVDAGYLFPSKYWVGVAEEYKDNEDPYSNITETLADDEGDRKTGYENSFKLSAGYGKAFDDRFAGQLDYTIRTVRYDAFEDVWEDEDENIVALTTYWGLTPKTAVKFVVTYAQSDFPKQEDGATSRGFNSGNTYNIDTLDFLVGLTFSPSAKITGDLLFGFGYGDFDDDTNVDGNPQDDPDGNFLTSIDLTWKVRERTELKGTAGYSYDTVDEAQRSWYNKTNFGVALKQGIIERLNLNLSVDYEHKDYNELLAATPGQEEDTFTGKIGLDYQIKKWLNATLQYEGSRSEKDKTTLVEDTDQNRVSLEISATY